MATTYIAAQVKQNYDGSLLVKVWDNEVFCFGATVVTVDAAVNMLKLVMAGKMGDITVYHADTKPTLGAVAGALEAAGLNVYRG